MSVGEVCNRSVVFIDKEGGIVEAAQLMRSHHVGTLVVVDPSQGKNPRPVGIITDRDIVIEIVAQEVDMGSATVGDVMSGNLVTARESDDLFDTIKMMRSKGVRRVPVLANDESLVGIISVDDIIDLLAEQLNDVVGLMLREQEREKTRRERP
jgi:CBS domain-containing protein